jgi:hypothetical protein
MPCKDGSFSSREGIAGRIPKTEAGSPRPPAALSATTMKDAAPESCEETSPKKTNIYPN